MQWYAVDTWAVGQSGKQPRRVHRIAYSLAVVAMLAVSLLLAGCDDDEDGAAVVDVSGARATLGTANGNVVDGHSFGIDARAFSTATSVDGLVTLSFANIIDTDGDGDFDTGTFTATSGAGNRATGTVAFLPNVISLNTDAGSTFPNNSGLGPDDLFTCSASPAICRIEVTGAATVDGPAALGTLTLALGPATTLQSFSSQPVQVSSNSRRGLL